MPLMRIFLNSAVSSLVNYGTFCPGEVKSAVDSCPDAAVPGVRLTLNLTLTAQHLSCTWRAE